MLMNAFYFKSTTIKVYPTQFFLRIEEIITYVIKVEISHRILIQLKLQKLKIS